MALATQPLYNALIRRSIDLQRLCQLAAQQVVEPGLRVVLLENAGHFPLEEPGVSQLRQALREFLAERGATVGATPAS